MLENNQQETLKIKDNKSRVTWFYIDYMIITINFFPGWIVPARSLSLYIYIINEKSDEKTSYFLFINILKKYFFYFKKFILILTY
jgi:hypothetical protein